MLNLFKHEQINVQQGLDIVQLCLKDRKIRMYYPTTFEICSGMQGAIKFAMRHEGLRPGFWKELNKYERSALSVPLHKGYRRSGHMSNFDKWKVDFEGSLIILTFDDEFFQMHFSDAAFVYAWMRRAAKECKHWAGDRSRIYNTYARLTDAEADDKVLYCET